MNLDMFNAEPIAQDARRLKDYVRTRDYKGAADYLRKLPNDDFFYEVLKAGFSVIGNHHPKSVRIEHVMRQLQNRS